MGKVIIKDNATGIKLSLDSLVNHKSQYGCRFDKGCNGIYEMETVTFERSFIDKLKTLTITEQVFDETDIQMLISYMGRHNEYDHPLFTKLEKMHREMRNT